MRLAEFNAIKLYHGDDHGTTDLIPHWMYHDDANAQEGVGIYFTPNLEAAKGYGSKISSITLSGTQRSRIAPSRARTSDYINQQQGTALITEIGKAHEDLWYLMTDYGIPITEPEEVEDYHYNDLFHAMAGNELRGFQIALASETSTTAFVAAWNKYVPILGLYEEESQFYSIINTGITAKPENF